MKPMRLALVTPFAVGSSIADNNALVAHELISRGHQVLIVATQVGGEPDRPSHGLEVVSWRDLSPMALAARCDVALVSIGNYPAYHMPLFGYLDALPCIGLFHDFSCHSLFTAWLAARGQTDLTDRHLKVTYPGLSQEEIQALRAPRVDEALVAALTPMTEWLAARCAGAVAHAPFYLPRLAATCPGPVAVAPLPMRARAPAFAAPDKREFALRRLVTFGHINRNKCADTVILALGSDPQLAARVEYRLAGPIDTHERQRLDRLAQQHGVSLRTLGRLDDEAYARELRDADVVCCLRRPNLEGASATCIEALQAGRPTLVADVGFYGDLPAGFVRKVPFDFTPSDVAHAVQEILANQPAFEARGAAARAWALEHFTAQHYADVVEPLARDVLRLGLRPRLLLAAAAELSDLEYPESGPAVGSYARELQALWSPNETLAARSLEQALAIAMLCADRSKPVDWDTALSGAKAPKDLLGRLADHIYQTSPPWLFPILRRGWRVLNVARRRAA